MGEYSNTFDWVQFPEGRARFAGGIRGGDERGHETFALEIAGAEYFGEIDQIFLSNGNDFNIGVVSFGYGIRVNVGNPAPEARQAFVPEQLERIRSLTLQLMEVGVGFDDRPIVLDEYPNAHFQRKVFFCEGWARELTKHSDIKMAQFACVELAP